MLNAINNFYLEKEEPVRSCLLAIKDMILSADPEISAAWKYCMPFFCYRNKMFCYLWVHKKLKLPYIGWVEGKRMQHPELTIEKRARMKILLIDPEKDLPVKLIGGLLDEALGFYKSGLVKIKLPGGRQ